MPRSTNFSPDESKVRVKCRYNNISPSSLTVNLSHHDVITDSYDNTFYL